MGPRETTTIITPATGYVNRMPRDTTTYITTPGHHHHGMNTTTFEIGGRRSDTTIIASDCDDYCEPDVTICDYSDDVDVTTYDSYDY